MNFFIASNNLKISYYVMKYFYLIIHQCIVNWNLHLEKKLNFPAIISLNAKWREKKRNNFFEHKKKELYMSSFLEKNMIFLNNCEIRSREIKEFCFFFTYRNSSANLRMIDSQKWGNKKSIIFCNHPWRREKQQSSGGGGSSKRSPNWREVMLSPTNAFLNRLDTCIFLQLSKRAGKIKGWRRLWLAWAGRRTPGALPS